MADPEHIWPQILLWDYSLCPDEDMKYEEYLLDDYEIMYLFAKLEIPINVLVRFQPNEYEP